MVAVWGGKRGAQAGLGYTGEWFDASVGLQYLRARWYDGETGAFLSRDAVEDNHPYQYSKANPIRYTDPTGLCVPDDISCQIEANYLYATYGWMIHQVWTIDQVRVLREAANSIFWFFNQNGGGDSAGRMRALFGEVNFLPQAGIFWNDVANAHVVRNNVYVEMMPNLSKRTIIHEMGHVLDNSIGPEAAAIFGGGPSDEMARSLGGRPELCYLRFDCGLISPSVSELNQWNWCNPPIWDTPLEQIDPGQYAAEGPSEDFAEAFLIAVDGYSWYQKLSLRPKRLQFIETLISQQVDTLSIYDTSQLVYPIYPVKTGGYPQ
jgi:RHS repeat-associated protein